MGNVPKSPLLGYNTNVRHDGLLFHIQTEDSGVDHPHIITHLFVAGTILSSKKTPYNNVLEDEDVEASIRALMKDQHRTMFIELRDGVHDEKAAAMSAKAPDESPEEHQKRISTIPEPPSSQQEDGPAKGNGNERVRVVRPAVIIDASSRQDLESLTEEPEEFSGRSIFDTPNEDGDFGEALITDKSLDEVILSYLTDDEEE